MQFLHLKSSVQTLLSTTAVKIKAFESEMSHRKIVLYTVIKVGRFSEIYLGV
jgi:hypothetical protein